MSPASRSDTAPWLLLAPGLLLVGLFLIWPICHGLWLSLHHFDGLEARGNISAGAYRAVLKDPLFHAALVHTVIFAAITVTGKTIAGLTLAVLVQSRLKGARQIELLLLLPVTLNIVVVGAFWTLLLASARFGGPLNSLLETLGYPGLTRAWLSESGLALVTVALVETWRWAGLHMLLFLAGLRGIEPSLYEAARIDGAGPWMRFRHITLPALGPVLAASTTLALIGAFVRSFDAVWVLTRASYGTDVLGTYIYRQAFSFGHFDRATAAGLMLAAGLTLFFSLTHLLGRWRKA